MEILFNFKMKYIEERSPGFNTFSIIPELKELFSYYEKNTVTCDKNKSKENDGTSD